MKTTKRQMTLQRNNIDAKIARLAPFREPRPGAGWIKAVRESLGMTTKQLASRMGTSGSNVTQLEARERKKTATLETLERAANAMGCDLVYAFVPKSPANALDDIVSDRAAEIARGLAERTDHTMQLESQGTSAEPKEKRLQRLIEELKASWNSKMWDERKKPAKK